VAADLAAGRVDAPPYGAARGVLITIEGIWGTGKTTTATALGERLAAAGFSTRVMHYGPRHGVVKRLSDMLDNTPLRRRDGLGGYTAAHHATVDVLLRLCREAYHHRVLYRPALAEHDVVVIDHGVYSKLAYALAVLTEQHPDQDLSALLAQVCAVTAPWFLHPDVALWLDMPWPLARERAIDRGHCGGDPGSVERLLFLPRYSSAYRLVADAHPDRVRRIRVGTRTTPSLLAEIDEILSPVLRTETGVLR
jgi:thymidylate kinase